MKMRFRLGVRLTASALAASNCLACSPAPPASASEELAAFIDAFATPERRDPSGDMSADAFAEELRKTRAFLDQLRQIDVSELSVDERIDWRFAESILLGREI